jgi:hypothetical protein
MQINDTGFPVTPDPTVSAAAVGQVGRAGGHYVVKCADGTWFDLTALAPVTVDAFEACTGTLVITP